MCFISGDIKERESDIERVLSSQPKLKKMMFLYQNCEKLIEFKLMEEYYIMD